MCSGYGLFSERVWLWRRLTGSCTKGFSWLGVNDVFPASGKFKYVVFFSPSSGNLFKWELSCLHGDNLHWGLVFHSSFVDLDGISRAQRCQNENTYLTYVFIYLFMGEGKHIFMQFSSKLCLIVTYCRCDQEHNASSYLQVRLREMIFVFLPWQELDFGVVSDFCKAVSGRKKNFTWW